MNNLQSYVTLLLYSAVIWGATIAGFYLPRKSEKAKSFADELWASFCLGVFFSSLHTLVVFFAMFDPKLASQVPPATILTLVLMAVVFIRMYIINHSKSLVQKWLEKRFKNQGSQQESEEK